MNKYMQYLKLSLIFVIILITACNDDDDTNSYNSVGYAKLEILKGNNQNGYLGEILNDTLQIKASANSKHRRYLVEYKTMEGNGGIKSGWNEYFGSNNKISVDSTGLIKLKWRLGCDNTIQKIKILVYVDSATYNYGNGFNTYYDYYQQASDSIVITAKGQLAKGWVRSAGYDHVDDYRTKIRSYDDKSLYLVSHHLFKSDDDGLNWTKIEGVPSNGELVDAHFNSSGWLYVLTRNDGICYTKDFRTWEFINNGIIDYRDPTGFSVDDDIMYVSFYFDGPYKTTNNGEFWKKMYVDGYGDRYYHFTRHPNGDVYMFDKWDNLWLSKDQGKLWQKMNLDYKYKRSEVEDLKIDNKGYLYIGSNDATIAKLSSNTYEGESHSYYQWNASSQHVNNITIKGDNAYYLVNYSPNPGIYSSANNWERIDIGFSDRIGSYYLKADGSFLVINNQGLYYHNK